jgi:hypothetical protein
MIEFCFATITGFVGRTIGVDLNEKDHVVRVNKNPTTDKPGKKDIEEKELLMSAKEYMEIRNEFDAEETTNDNLYTIILEYIELAKEEDLDNPKFIKMNRLVELKQKLKFTQINLDPISIDITDTQATHLDWKKWKEDALQECKNKKSKRLVKKQDIINKKVQNDFPFDPKRTVRRISKDSSPICEIDTNELENFWSDRWSKKQNSTNKTLMSSTK